MSSKLSLETLTLTLVALEKASTIFMKASSSACDETLPAQDVQRRAGFGLPLAFLREGLREIEQRPARPATPAAAAAP